VTALEDETSTSSFVPDSLVAGADDMNFINNKEMSAGSRGVGGQRSSAGSFAVGGRRVHFSNSDGGGVPESCGEYTSAPELTFAVVVPPMYDI
jgi:hypothetical protein